jgi:hypothetical protein
MFKGTMRRLMAQLAVAALALVLMAGGAAAAGVYGPSVTAHPFHSHGNDGINTAAGTTPAETTATAAASAVVSGRHVVAGNCSAGSRARLTLSRDDGHVEAEMEIHTAKVGQHWRLQFSTEGVGFATVVRITRPEDGRGGLSVSRLATDHAGPDVITVQARNLDTNELCTVQGTF